EMILMRVREHDADEVAALLDQEPDVGKDEIDPGQQVLASERHAEVDGEPGPAALGARAVDREIHPDLADAAERREHELAGSAHQSGPWRWPVSGWLPPVGSATDTSFCVAAKDPFIASGKISPAVMTSSAPSSRRSRSRPISSNFSNRPSSAA